MDMSRRRGKRQEPDATDAELERAMQSTETPIKEDDKQSSDLNGPSKGKSAKKSALAAKNTGQSQLFKDSESQDQALASSSGDDPSSVGGAGLGDLEEKSSPSTHPFWSDKAKLEAALVQARPPDLDAEARRFTGEDLDLSRPVDLEERGRSRKEVVVDEGVLEPEYSPVSGALVSLGGQASQEGELDSPDRNTEFLEIPRSTVDDVGMSASRAKVSAGDEGISVPEQSVQVRRKSDGALLDEQALEIARLRSMVDYLQGSLQYAEECKSYDSSSNPAMDHASHVQDSRSTPQPPVTSVSPRLPSSTVVSSYNPELSGMPVPPVFNISNKPTPDPFREYVMVQGVPHRWVRVGDKLYLEPLVLREREGSPPPPPPKDTPPPSPPPLPIPPYRLTPTAPAPEDPGSLALALRVVDSGLSCLGLGDVDGSRSGAQSYLSVDSGGYEDNKGGLDHSDAPHPPSVRDLQLNSLGPSQSHSGTAQHKAIVDQVDLLLQGRLPMTQFVQAVADQVASSCSLSGVGSMQAGPTSSAPVFPGLASASVGPYNASQASPGVGQVPQGPCQSSSGVGQVPQGPCQSSSGVGQAPQGPCQSLPGVGQVPQGPCQSLPGVGQVPQGPCQSLPGVGQVPQGPCQSLPGVGQVPQGPCQSLSGVGQVPQGPCQSLPGVGQAPQGPCQSLHRRRSGASRSVSAVFRYRSCGSVSSPVSGGPESTRRSSGLGDQASASSSVFSFRA